MLRAQKLFEKSESQNKHRKTDEAVQRKGVCGGDCVMDFICFKCQAPHPPPWPSPHCESVNVAKVRGNPLSCTLPMGV